MSLLGFAKRNVMWWSIHGENIIDWCWVLKLSVIYWAKWFHQLSAIHAGWKNLPSKLLLVFQTGAQLPKVALLSAQSEIHGLTRNSLDNWGSMDNCAPVWWWCLKSNYDWMYKPYRLQWQCWETEKVSLLLIANLSGDYFRDQKIVTVAGLSL